MKIKRAKLILVKVLGTTLKDDFYQFCCCCRNSERERERLSMAFLTYIDIHKQQNNHWCYARTTKIISDDRRYIIYPCNCWNEIDKSWPNQEYWLKLVSLNILIQ